MSLGSSSCTKQQSSGFTPVPVPVFADSDRDSRPVQPDLSADEFRVLYAAAEEEDLTDPDEDDEDLLSSVFDTDGNDDVNQSDLMTIAVDYAFKRGKIKKKIRKTCRKLIKKYSLEPDGHTPVRAFMENSEKRFVRAVCDEYGESPEQALDSAYFGAVWSVLSCRDGHKFMEKNEKDLWSALEKQMDPKDLRENVFSRLPDKKGKAGKILKEYTEKMDILEIWDNVDGRMKKKLLKGAYWLGALKAMKN